jgi:hypothetical protein
MFRLRIVPPEEPRMPIRHADLELPPDNQLIWRHMNIEKLLALLQTERLFFAPLRLMKDPFEGHFPPSLRAWVLEQIGDQLLRKNLTEEDLYKHEREIQYVSCWHVNSDDSAAMWSLYSGTAGVAIRSTVGRLWDCLAVRPEAVTIGMVRYLDFAQFVPDPLQPVRITHIKRRSFEHERELRASICAPAIVDGLHFPVDCRKLILDIVVSPEAQDWITLVLRNVVQTYGFSIDVKKSDLYTLA